MRLRHALLTFLPSEWPLDSWPPLDLAASQPPALELQERLLGFVRGLGQAAASATS